MGNRAANSGRCRMLVRRKVQEMSGIGEQSEKIVDAIIDDLTDRGGFNQVWDSVGEDIQAEIRSEWMLRTRRILEQK